jgi:hypothetical protein
MDGDLQDPPKNYTPFFRYGNGGKAMTWCMLCEQNVGRVLQEVAYKTFYRIMLAVDF